MRQGKQRVREIERQRKREIMKEKVRETVVD